MTLGKIETEKGLKVKLKDKVNEVLVDISCANHKIRRGKLKRGKIVFLIRLRSSHKSPEAYGNQFS